MSRRRTFFSAVAPSALRRVVLARPDRLGDLVLTAAWLDPIREALPETEIHLLAEPRFLPLVQRHPALSGTLASRLARENSRERRKRLRHALKDLRPDAILHLNGDCDILQAARRARIPLRVGFHKGSAGHFLTHSLKDRRKRADFHETGYIGQVLSLLGVPSRSPQELRPGVQPEPTARNALTNLLEWWPHRPPYAVLHPAAHGDKPRLPPEVFVTCAQYLVETCGWRVVLAGRESDDPTVRALNEQLGRHELLVDLSGELDPPALAWLLEAAGLFVGRDSGPAQLAAAMGCPSVVVIGPLARRSGEIRWHPLGRGQPIASIDAWTRPGLLETTRRFQQRCLASVTPEMVLSEVRQLVGTESTEEGLSNPSTTVEA